MTILAPHPETPGTGDRRVETSVGGPISIGESLLELCTDLAFEHPEAQALVAQLAGLLAQSHQYMRRAAEARSRNPLSKYDEGVERHLDDCDQARYGATDLVCRLDELGLSGRRIRSQLFGHIALALGT